MSYTNFSFEWDDVGSEDDPAIVVDSESPSALGVITYCYGDQWTMEALDKETGTTTYWEYLCHPDEGELEAKLKEWEGHIFSFKNEAPQACEFGLR